MSRERELLERVISGDDAGDFFIGYKLYKDIETFLDQPEQEPVAWMNDSGGCFLSDGNKYSENWTALYTAPQEREPLSEDKLDVLAEANITDEGIAGYYLGFRDAEKMHGIGVDDDN